MNWVWAGKCPAWFIPSGEAHSASGILFSTRKLNSVLALQILGYETLQRPALSCTRNKRTVIAAPHNTYSLLLSAYSASSLSVPRKPSHGLTSLWFCLQRSLEPALATPVCWRLLDSCAQAPGKGRNIWEKLFMLLLKDFPVLSTLQTSQSMQIVTSLEFLLAEVQEGAECLGALLSIPFSAALTIRVSQRAQKCCIISIRPREEDYCD